MSAQKTQSADPASVNCGCRPANRVAVCRPLLGTRRSHSGAGDRLSRFGLVLLTSGAVSNDWS